MQVNCVVPSCMIIFCASCNGVHPAAEILMLWDPGNHVSHCWSHISALVAAEGVQACRESEESISRIPIMRRHHVSLLRSIEHISNAQAALGGPVRCSQVQELQRPVYHEFSSACHLMSAGQQASAATMIAAKFWLVE